MKRQSNENHCTLLYFLGSTTHLETTSVPLFSPEHAVIDTNTGIAHANDFIVSIAVLCK